jgi:P27 family predicted phage terminase small subunit
MPRRTGSGRKPKALEDHIAEGTYRPERHGPTESVIRKADGKRPPLPPGFNLLEKRAWKRLLDGLEAESLLDHADAPLYEVFVVQWARVREARAEVHKHGTLVTGPTGGLVANPAIKIERDASDRVRQLADQLAIGIHTRASLNLSIARGRRGDRTEEGDVAPKAADSIGPSPRLRSVK